MIVALIAYAILGLAYWAMMAYGLVRIARGVPHLGGLHPPDPPRWPRLSVIVPACNEADKIGPALATLMAEDYPDLEIIVIDDRSTDSTGKIIDRAAAADGRVKAIHIKELPAGWLGKVHALQRGVEAAGGEWLLLTDADIHFRRGVLRRAVAYAEAERFDHLAALPDLWPTHRALDAGLAAFIRQFLVFTRAWKVSDPASAAFIGVGAFNLLRRAALEKTPGLEWLRLEPADDAGLGLMMKRAGARCGLVAAFDQLGLHWYRTLGEAARGAEKGYASVMNFSAARGIASALVTLALEMAPILALVPLALESVRPIGYAGLGIFALDAIAAAAMGAWAGWGKFIPALTSPLFSPIGTALMIRVAILGWRRGGIVWRGTLYPTEVLREGKRVKIF